MVMYLVYYNYSNAGPECQAKVSSVTTSMKSSVFGQLRSMFIGLD